jgi:hypothetical protein
MSPATDLPTLPVPNPTRSFWHATHPNPLVHHRTTADLPTRASVVIIGSGITGVFAARELIASGVTEVVVLEARDICSGATGRVSLTTKLLSCIIFLTRRNLCILQFDVYLVSQSTNNTSIENAINRVFSGSMATYTWLEWRTLPTPPLQHPILLRLFPAKELPLPFRPHPNVPNTMRILQVPPRRLPRLLLSPSLLRSERLH